MNKNNNDQDPAKAKTRLSQPDYPSDDKSSISAQSRSEISSKDTQNHNKALTQIESSFQSNETEKGFAAAKHDADQALAENKIILNNRFVLKETLGSGGMGTVYKAQDLRKVEARDSHPYVAAKILNSDFKNHPDAFISLQREASRSHLLSHPNIVTVHDFDRDGDTIFMTMELLDGLDLELLLARHKKSQMPYETAINIFKDFCSALIFAHKKGIIHSDLKPGNIFVTQSEGTKVLDFGIARLALESKRKDHFDAGRIGAITPAYASLEMLGHKPPDARDDVYAAAIIAYELFTGEHPFGTKSAAVALAKGLKPKRIESLSKRQWDALSNGLELKRKDRIASIQALLDGITVKPKLPLLSFVSVALVGLISWFVYSQYFAPNELNQVIKETMSRAEQCFNNKNYRCAIESANAVLEIAPKHQQAKRITTQAAIDEQVTAITQCNASDKSIDCALSHLQILKSFSPPKSLLSSIARQIESRKIVLNINQLILEAKLCFDDKNFQCTRDKVDDVLELQPSHAEASALSVTADKALTEQKSFIQSQNSQYHRYYKKATRCQQNRNFDCALKNARLAVKYKPTSQAAIDLSQDALYAKKQQQDSLTKADNILADGYLCLKKLDYSCAIAKSESALVFVPNYKKALQLKRDATESLNSVKKRIKIE